MSTSEQCDNMQTWTGDSEGQHSQALSVVCKNEVRITALSPDQCGSVGWVLSLEVEV